MRRMPAPDFACSMTVPKSLLALAAACTLLMLSGCSAVGVLGLQTTSQVVYARWSDAPRTGDPDVVPPAFVPRDAKVVTLRTLLDGHGSILRFTSKSPLDPRLCRAGTLTGRPRLDTNWWPIGRPPARGMRCSPDWRVFVRSGTSYAWAPS